MAPFPSFTGPPAEAKAIRIPTFRSPTAKTQPAPVPQNRDEARAARLKTSGEGQWASLDALASAGPSSLAHLLAKRHPSTFRAIASSSSSRPKPTPEPSKKAAVARKSPRKSGARGDVGRTMDAAERIGEAAPPLAVPSKPTKRLPRACASPTDSMSTADATPTVPPSAADNDHAPPPPPPPAASTSASTKKPRKSTAKTTKVASNEEGDEGGATKEKKPLKRKSAAAAVIEEDGPADEAAKPAKERRSSVNGKGKAKEAEQDSVEEDGEREEPIVPVAKKAQPSSTKKTEAAAVAHSRTQKEPKRRRSTRVAEPAAASPPPLSPPANEPADTTPADSAPKKKRARKSVVQADERDEVEQDEPKPKKARRSAAKAGSTVNAKVKSQGRAKGKEKAVATEDGERPPEARRAIKRKRPDTTAAAATKAAKRRAEPSAASTSTSQNQPAASTSRQSARRARSPNPITSDDDDDDDVDAGDKSKKKGVKVRTERLKGNKGKLNVFDVVAGGTRRMLDQFIEEHGKDPRTLKLLQRFASNVQSPLLSRSGLLSTLTAHSRSLNSARTKSKKLRLELVETQQARGEVEREMRRREEDWAREEKEVEAITSTHDFFANLSAASAAWR
ncbi:hypothetical protein JCM10296v2_007479 [Rhodotorula toruloides]